MQGGSNHLLGLPTSLLQRWYEHAGAASVFSGGVVRIERTNSSAILKAYPGEVSASLQPAAVALLRRLGHSARQWNPSYSRVEGGEAPEAGAPFVRFTLPAWEVRRLIREARACGEPFRLEYTQLAGSGDERWRHTSTGRRVVVTSDECTVWSAETEPPSPCGEDELPRMPPPERWSVLNGLGGAQSWSSYVLVDEADTELHCF